MNVEQIDEIELIRRLKCVHLLLSNEHIFTNRKQNAFIRTEIRNVKVFRFSTFISFFNDKIIIIKVNDHSISGIPFLD